MTTDGPRLVEYVEKYKERFGFYPEKVLADKIYSTRDNWKWIKEKGIKISAKAPGPSFGTGSGRPRKTGGGQPNRRQFGQAKNGYGMNRIRARLKQTNKPVMGRLR